MGIIQGTVTDSSLRNGRTAFVRCLTRKELTVKPRFLQTRRIWVVSVSSKMCQATASGDCVLVLVMTGPSSAPHFTRRSGLRSLGRTRRSESHEGGDGCLICGRRGRGGPLRRHSPKAYANEFA